MRRLQRLRIEDRIADTVLLVSHPEVLTLGPRAVKDGATPPDGFDAIATDRGGIDVAWARSTRRLSHHPLEHGIGTIRGCDRQPARGMDHRRLPSARHRSSTRSEDAGVWVGEWKIVSIGLSFLHWVSRHGVSINIDPDLSRLEQVAGCGLDPGMTSSLEALGFPCTRDEVVAALLATFPASLERPAEGHSVNTPPPWRDLSAPPWDAHPVRTDP